MEQYETLDVEQRSDRLWIAFDRPEHANAVTDRMHEELATVFADAGKTDARVAVLTGNGDYFSGGGDFSFMRQSQEDLRHYLEVIKQGEAMLRNLIRLEIPVVARVNGDAVGLGATLALFSDVVIAREDARIGDTHIRAGLAAGDGGAVIWPLLTSLNKAKELLMTGEVLTAVEAEELGLVNYVVAPEDLDAKVEELVSTLASGPHPATGYTKLACNKWLELGLDLILRESMALEGLTSRLDDHDEAVDAFLNDRQPEFSS